MHFVLFTTTDLAERRSQAFERFLSLLSASSLVKSVTLHLLVQNAPHQKIELPSFVVRHDYPQVVSLSKARNILLSSVDWKTIPDDTIVAFPDDDSFYDHDCLSYVSRVFSNDPQLDFFFCKYASNPTPAGSASLTRPKAAEVVRNASSNTLFLRASLARRVGLFDETLGVGAQFVGGEDIEYAIRAYRGARTSLFLDVPLVGHRDKIAGLRGRYYPGNVLALGRHALRDPGVMVEYLRKLAIGVVLVIRGEITARVFLSSLTTSLGRMVRKPSCSPLR